MSIKNILNTYEVKKEDINDKILKIKKIDDMSLFELFNFFSEIRKENNDLSESINNIFIEKLKFILKEEKYKLLKNYSIVENTSFSKHIIKVVFFDYNLKILFDIYNKEITITYNKEYIEPYYSQEDFKLSEKEFFFCFKISGIRRF